MNLDLDVKLCLKNLGIKSNELVMIHGDAGISAQYMHLSKTTRLDYLVEQLKQYFTPEGTIIVPTFSYSFTKGEDFDKENTPSDIGLFSENFRKSYGMIRSNHPIFSVSSFGKLATFFSDSNIDDCFGTDTIFDMLYKNNGTILCLGCELDRITFVHYVEQKYNVPYRYLKTFTGSMNKSGNMTFHDVTFFVRNENLNASCDLTKFKIRALEMNKLKRSTLGRFPVYAIKARDFLNISIDLLKSDIYSLIKEGNK